MSSSSACAVVLLSTILICSNLLMTAAAESDIYDNRESKGLNAGMRMLIDFHSTSKDCCNFSQSEKREFYLGSRYGRSQADMASIDDEKIELPNTVGRVMQRNDRFFLGSRYGKRSSSSIDDEQKENIKCVYTGVKNFFRCIESDDKN